MVLRRPSTEKYELMTLGARPEVSVENGKFFHPFYTCGQTVVQNKDRFQSSCTWHCACTSESVERYLTASLGVLLGVLMLGSLGVFLVYVPILPLAVVVTIVLGLILMFMLGVQTGGRIRISRRKSASRSLVVQSSSPTHALRCFLTSCRSWFLNSLLVARQPAKRPDPQ